MSCGARRRPCRTRHQAVSRPVRNGRAFYCLLPQLGQKVAPWGTVARHCGQDLTASIFAPQCMQNFAPAGLWALQAEQVVVGADAAALPPPMASRTMPGIIAPRPAPTPRPRPAAAVAAAPLPWLDATAASPIARAALY